MHVNVYGLHIHTEKKLNKVSLQSLSRSLQRYTYNSFNMSEIHDVKYINTPVH